MTGQTLLLLALLPLVAAAAAWLVLWDTCRAARARAALAAEQAIRGQGDWWDDLSRRNLAAFRYEERAAVAVLRPEWFVKITDAS